MPDQDQLHFLSSSARAFLHEVRQRSCDRYSERMGDQLEFIAHGAADFSELHGPVKGIRIVLKSKDISIPTYFVRERLSRSHQYPHVVLF